MKLRLSAFTLAAALAAGAPVLAQDAAAGGALFKQRCQMCHAVTPGQTSTMAPSLVGVVGRKAGSTDFNYSSALKASSLVWDKPTLDQFLTAPYKLIPGTRMVVSLPDAKQRADVVAYLGTLKK